MDLFTELDRYQRDWRVFEPKPNRRAEAETRYRSGLGRDPDALLLVAELDGGVVGMAFVRVALSSSISNERIAELSNVVVLPEARGRGIGRALVAEVGRWAAAREAWWVAVRTYSENREALAFWERLGFEPRYVQMTVPAEELAARPPVP
jgi:GNAT superfamily N-acetyltransferase